MWNIMENKPAHGNVCLVWNLLEMTCGCMVVDISTRSKLLLWFPFESCKHIQTLHLFLCLAICWCQMPFHFPCRINPCFSVWKLVLARAKSCWDWPGLERAVAVSRAFFNRESQGFNIFNRIYINHRCKNFWHFMLHIEYIVALLWIN